MARARYRRRHFESGYGSFTLCCIVSLLGCSGGTPASPTMAPMLSSASPAAAAVDDRVTLTGENFTATANHVKVGGGYLHNLSSIDGKTVLFTVPHALDVCAPDQQVCPALAVVLSPGEYKLSVINGRGASNEISFTIIER
jgi:hypothetical protein